jgi:endogenous inhibitor of DNA gyrase (YacG/DUF329 family)
MSDAAPPETPAKPCPVCRKPATAKHKPFCSQRCATIDLARWVTGTYRVPTNETPEDASSPDERDDTP